MWETNTGDCDVPRAGNVMVNWKIRWAINAWLSDATAAEATYGHISTWETGGVTDMEELFYDEDFSSFNEDIGAWDTSGVTTMRYMFNGASAFDQDLGWCVDDGVSLWNAFSGTQCASPSCGVNNMAALRCGGTMSDTTIRTAVMTWLYDRAAAEATYGHISTWKTGRVTDMAWLFLGKSSFNEDISAWDTSGVTAMQEMFEDAEAFNQDISGWRVGKVKNMAFMFYNAYAFNQPIGGWSIFNRPIGGWSIEAVKIMRSMFEGASAFDQDLGWCVENDVVLNQAFLGTSCYSNACGVGQKDAIGMCEPWARPCLIAGGPSQCIINSPTIIIAIVLILLTGFGAYVHRKKKKDETYVAAARRLFPDSELRAELLYSCLRFCCRKTEPGSVSSRPDSLAKSPSEDSDEEATAPESLETRAAAAKAKAAETVERPPGFARKLSSFLFGEEQKPTEQLPPPPARRTEPEPAAKFEEMYNQIAAWYNEPENAALRAIWGTYPEPDEFQTWPGFVAVTNAYLDREAG
jgi:surface protein